MTRNITKETINTIKDGAVVELGANAEIKIKGKSVVVTIDGKESIYRKEDYTESQLVKYINMQIDNSNHKKIYNIINRLFTEMDYNLTFEFGGFTFGLAETEDDAMWWEKGIYVIPTDAKEEDGEWDWDAATFYTLEPYFKTFADLLRGDRDIIGDMTNLILRDMETVAPYLPTGGTTETHKTVVVDTIKNYLDNYLPSYLDRFGECVITVYWNKFTEEFKEMLIENVAFANSVRDMLLDNGIIEKRSDFAVCDDGVYVTVDYDKFFNVAA